MFSKKLLRLNLRLVFQNPKNTFTPNYQQAPLPSPKNYPQTKSLTCKLKHSFPSFFLSFISSKMLLNGTAHSFFVSLVLTSFLAFNSLIVVQCANDRRRRKPTPAEIAKNSLEQQIRPERTSKSPTHSSLLVSF